MDEIELATAIVARQDEAARGPQGTWAQIWVPGVCKHERIRCVHADEIVRRNFRRRACLDCGRSLKGPLPDRCWFSPTGERHG